MSETPGQDNSEQEAPAAPATKLDKREERKDDVGWPDVAAIGIGCLVFVIFFGAIVIVGIMRGQ